MKRISIKDIAELSGFSVATVSRVINNNGRFSDETRKKILSVIQETGYQTNYSAKSLRMNRSFSIGVLVPDIRNFFFSEVVQKIEEIFFNKGYSTIICNTDRNPHKELAYLRILESKMVDGLIIISGAEKFDSDKTIIGKNISYICIDREPVNYNDTVFISSNHYQGGFEATDFMLKSGAVFPVIARQSRESTSSSERKRGFIDALKENGLQFNSVKNELIIDKNKYSLFDNLKEKLIKYPKIDAIFSINDSIAVELIDILPDLNKRIPQDLQLIGFDNSPMAKICTPKLSTVEQNTDEIALLATESLINLIEKNQYNNQNIYYVPVKLVLRNSTL